MHHPEWTVHLHDFTSCPPDGHRCHCACRPRSKLVGHVQQLEDEALLLLAVRGVGGSDPAADTPSQGRSDRRIDSLRPPERAWDAARFEQDSAMTRAESSVIGFRR